MLFISLKRKTMKKSYKKAYVPRDNLTSEGYPDNPMARKAAGAQLYGFYLLGIMGGQRYDYVGINVEKSLGLLIYRETLEEKLINIEIAVHEKKYGKNLRKKLKQYMGDKLKLDNNEKSDFIKMIPKDTFFGYKLAAYLS